MQELQLFIENQKVELFKDETISITQSIQNVRDIAKVFTDFSKPFTLPATKSNNKIFKHYYNFNIEDGFDARIKKDARIELNYLPFKKGKIKLEGVELRNNKPYAYKIVFFGNTVTLKDLLGDDSLESLSGLNDESLIYDSNQIKSKLTVNPSTTNIIAPLITHTQRLFYDSTVGHSHDDQYSGNLRYVGGGGHVHGVKYNELKYAIRVDRIVREIESRYNITFSSNFFNSLNAPYYNLFMWLHRKKGKVENLDGVNETLVDGFTGSLISDDFTQTWMINSSTLRILGNPDYYDLFELELKTTSTDSYKVIILRDGLDVFKTLDVVGDVTIPLMSSRILQQGDFSILIVSENNITFSSIDYNVIYSQPNTTSHSITYSTNTYTSISAFNFIITRQIPKIKVIDFLTGLFKMFNLTAYVNEDTNEIVVQTLDSYYENRNTYDISKFVDVNSSSVNVALPYREVNFFMEDTNTLLAKQHEQLAGKSWGKEEYKETTNGKKGKPIEVSGDIYNVKVPFAKFKYERILDTNGGVATTIQWGYSVDDNQDSYIGKPLLFYPILQSSGTTDISFVESDTVNSSLSSYIIPSNSLTLDATVNSDNINFGLEANEYTATKNFENTLFNKYYRKYILGIFNERNRLTKVSAYLPLRILLNYSLGDRFVINGNTYKINSSTVNLQTSKTDLELLNDIIIEDDVVTDQIPPANVQGLSTTNPTNNSISIQWTANSETDLAGYRLYVNGSLYTILGVQTSYTIIGLQPSTTYDIRLTAYDINGNESSYANASEVSETTTSASGDTTPPNDVQNLTLTNKTTSSLSVSWGTNTDTDLDGYNVYVDNLLVASLSGTSYTITGLNDGASYTVKVTAYDTSGNISSLLTAPSITETTLAINDTTPPSVPTNLSANLVGAFEIGVQWTASTDNVGIALYRVYVDNIVQTPSNNNTFYTVSNLQPNTQYSITVEALDASGNRSGKSSPLLVTTIGI